MSAAVVDLIFVIVFGIFIFKYYTNQKSNWISFPITKPVMS
jgi:hypothetical protein